jgi:hypothetical protein
MALRIILIALVWWNSVFILSGQKNGSQSIKQYPITITGRLFVFDKQCGGAPRMIETEDVLIDGVLKSQPKSYPKKGKYTLVSSKNSSVRYVLQSNDLGNYQVKLMPGKYYLHEYNFDGKATSKQSPNKIPVKEMDASEWMQRRIAVIVFEKTKRKKDLYIDLGCHPMTSLIPQTPTNECQPVPKEFQNKPTDPMLIDDRNREYLDRRVTEPK